MGSVLCTSRNQSDRVDSEIVQLSSNLRRFTYSELKKAINGFCPGNIVGDGAYSVVYRGDIGNQVYAVKVCKTMIRTQVLQELRILAGANHPNLVCLIGIYNGGSDGSRRTALFLEYIDGGTLHKRLHEPPQKPPLTWAERIGIARGVAAGLCYLHVDRESLHLNLKSRNVLLRTDLVPKLCDLGNGKRLSDLVQVPASGVELSGLGTLGYMYVEAGDVNESLKSDIYSFGILLLELITGSPSMDFRRQSQYYDLGEWAMHRMNSESMGVDLADPRMQGDYPTLGLTYALQVAKDCISRSPANRPTAAGIVTSLGRQILLN